jgi:DNA transposition AAA+ family ATPase
VTAAAPIPFVPPKDEGPALHAEPSTSTVTADRYSAAASWLKDYKANSPVSKTWEEIAQELTAGVKPETVRIWAGGNYELRNAGPLTLAVERFRLTVEARRSLITNTSFVNTTVARRMFKLIKRCQVFGKMGLAAFAPGTGKTSAVNEYWRNSGETCIRIPVNLTFAPRNHTTGRSTYPAIAALARQLNIAPERVTSTERLYSLTAERLRGSTRIVIFDRAEDLPQETFTILTELHEDTGVPIIFTGHEELYERGPRDFEKLTAMRSRMFRERFRQTDLTAEDVELIAAQMVGVSLTKSLSRRLLEQARMPGGLRHLVAVLQSAQMHADGRGKVTEEAVLAGIADMADGGAL